MVWIACGLLAIVMLGGCGSPATQSRPGFNAAYRREIKPYAFNYTEWEWQTFKGMFKQKFSAGPPDSGDDIQAVLNFFQIISTREQIENQSGQAAASGKTAQAATFEARSAELERTIEEARPRVESILSRQIALTLAQSGIHNPFLNNLLPVTFPPLSFELEPSLNLLVISPRQKIERLRDTVIGPRISLAQSQKLESELESYDVSALVIPLGGLGATYPSFVIESSDLEFTLKVVAEEWLHQYLFFRPLGFQYVLELTGVNRDPDIPALNETIVGVAADEIGEAVFQSYYAADYPAAPAVSEATTAPPAKRFDFDAAMRETRLRADALLAAGQIAEAESYMEERRLLMVAQGYNIRRLNQAYFAFYGSYANQGSSVDPLGAQVRQLRQQSPTLGDYLRTASHFTSRQALQKYLAQMSGE
jgi:hypothetical protein